MDGREVIWAQLDWRQFSILLQKKPNSWERETSALTAALVLLLSVVLEKSAGDWKAMLLRVWEIALVANYVLGKLLRKVLVSQAQTLCFPGWSSLFLSQQKAFFRSQSPLRTQRFAGNEVWKHSLVPSDMNPNGMGCKDLIVKRGGWLFNGFIGWFSGPSADWGLTLRVIAASRE